MSEADQLDTQSELARIRDAAYIVVLEHANDAAVAEIAQLKADLANARADRDEIWSRWQASKVMR